MREASAALELEAIPRASNVGDAALQGFCVGAGQLEPLLARSEQAPACRFLPGAE